MNICDMYNKMYRIIDYIWYLKSHDEKETNIINIIFGIFLLIFGIVFVSWWMLPIRLLKEVHTFKIDTCVVIYKDMWYRTVKKNEIEKWIEKGWIPKAIIE